MGRGTPAMRVFRSAISHTVLMGLSVVFLIPFAWLVTTSLKSESHLNAYPPEWLPRGEYLEVAPGEWAEVVRMEHLEYAQAEKDAEGKVLPRRPLKSKVNLVDAFGNPLKEFVCRVPAGTAVEELDSGTFSPTLRHALAAAAVALGPNVEVRTVKAGRVWQLQDSEKSCFLEKPRRGSERLSVYLNTAARVVESRLIQTRIRPTLRHYVKGVQAFTFDMFLQNTLLIAAVAVLGTVLSSSWVAFGFSILQWPGRDKVFYLMLATMMLPGQVTMIPLFVIFTRLGWVNTYLPLLVPAFLGNAFFIFLLRQFFLTIPKDLIDAARVDGCGTFRIYGQIVMPLSVPALATVALFTFMGSWNDFMGPLLYVVDEAKYTLSLGLAMFKGRFATRYGEMMAVSVLLTIPIIVLFFFTQKTFIQGIKTTGMKG